MVKITAGGASTHVIIDVVGYVTTGTSPDGLYHAVVPARIADTRSGLGGRTLAPGQTLDLPVAGQGGIPDAGADEPGKHWAGDPERIDPDDYPPQHPFVRLMTWAPCLDCASSVHTYGR